MKLSETCCNCGKTFSRQQGEKSYSRKSLESTAVVNKVNKTLGALVEEEFDVTLTPDRKRQRFLCSECTWAFVSVAKSTSTRREALSKIKERSGATYLPKKLRSPVPTPRKLKKNENHVATKSKQNSHINCMDWLEHYQNRLIRTTIKNIYCSLLELAKQSLETEKKTAKKKRVVCRIFYKQLHIV